jgi:hypothetical protein
MAWLLRYSFTPGPASRAVDYWPAAAVSRSGPATLVMAVHPYCPCTRASFEELSRVLAKIESQVGSSSLVLLSFLPALRMGENRAMALRDALPATQVIEDAGGRQALSSASAHREKQPF